MIIKLDKNKKKIKTIKTRWSQAIVIAISLNVIFIGTKLLLGNEIQSVRAEMRWTKIGLE